MSNSVKTVALLVIVAVIGVVIYRQVRWYTTGRQQARQETKEQVERQTASAFTRPLREKGKQQFGRFLVEAKHVAGLEFADVTIRETKGDTVTQEIKAGGMTIEYATEATTIGQLSDLTITAYDKEGSASSTSRDEAAIYFTNGMAGPTGIVGDDWADRGDPMSKSE